MNRKEWIMESEKEFERQMGPHEQLGGYREWAELLADGEDSYFEAEYTPKAAVAEELSYV